MAACLTSGRITYPEILFQVWLLNNPNTLLDDCCMETSASVKAKMKGAIISPKKTIPTMNLLTQTPPLAAALSADSSAMPCAWSIISNCLDWFCAKVPMNFITNPEIPPPSMAISSGVIIYLKF